MSQELAYKAFRLMCITIMVVVALAFGYKLIVESGWLKVTAIPPTPAPVSATTIPPVVTSQPITPPLPPTATPVPTSAPVVPPTAPILPPTAVPAPTSTPALIIPSTLQPLPPTPIPTTITIFSEPKRLQEYVFDDSEKSYNIELTSNEQVLVGETFTLKIDSQSRFARCGVFLVKGPRKIVITAKQGYLRTYEGVKTSAQAEELLQGVTDSLTSNPVSYQAGNCDKPPKQIRVP